MWRLTRKRDGRLAATPRQTKAGEKAARGTLICGCFDSGDTLLIVRLIVRARAPISGAHYPSLQGHMQAHYTRIRLICMQGRVQDFATGGGGGLDVC